MELSVNSLSDLSEKSFYFIGIGGVGMAALANLVLDLNGVVYGSDLVVSKNSELLSKRGAHINIGPHSEENVSLKSIDYLIVSSAINPENREYIRAKSIAHSTMKRGRFLAYIGQLFPTSIAVSGSHGKTTTTALLVHIFTELGLKPGFTIGGEVTGWEKTGSAGDGSILITEVDESDGTQAYFSADYSIILNIEDDHSWSAGGLEKLLSSFKIVAGKSKKSFTWPGHFTEKLLKDFKQVEFLELTEIPVELQLLQPGLHNRINAFSALKVAEELGLNRDLAIDALNCFPGVRRRMTLHQEDCSRNVVLIEDYAHHPTEVHYSIDALRESYPDHQLMVIFQPHRNERIRHYGLEFAKELDAADEVIVVSPFMAWITGEELVDPQIITDNMTLEKKRYIAIENGDFTPLAELFNQPLSNTVVAVFGAGDIVKAIPLLQQRIF